MVQRPISAAGQSGRYAGACAATRGGIWVGSGLGASVGVGGTGTGLAAPAKAAMWATFGLEIRVCGASLEAVGAIPRLFDPRT